jgi:hypothetical protein
MRSVLAPSSYAPPTELFGAIDPAIDHALSAYPSALARRAVAPIRFSLGGSLGCRRSARCRSRLTGDGYPFELSFSGADQERLRFTAEPIDVGGSDGASVAPSSRLSRARALLDAIGEDPGENDVWEALAETQAGLACAFGAWIGGRVERDATTFKVYVEIPAGACMPQICPAGPALSDRSVVPRMAGYTPSTGALESYFRIASLEPEHLVGVLDAAGMGARAGALVAFIEHAYGYRLRGRLPGPSVGVSYVSGPSPRVTLHLYARSIWGSDARIRQGFARLFAEYGRDAETYLKVTQPIQARESWHTFHGLLGFTLDPALAQITPSIGLRPVAP